MYFLIDIFLVVLILITVMTHRKRGFAQTILSLIIVIASLVIATFCAGHWAQQFSELVTEPEITKRVEIALDEKNNNDTISFIEENSFNLQNLLKSYSADYDGVLDSARTAIANGTGDVTNAVAEYIAKPIAYKTSYAILLISSFFISMILLRIVLFRILGLVDMMPVVHEINHILGAIIGVVFGLIYAIIASMLIRGFEASLTENCPQIFVPGFYDKTIVYKLFVTLGEAIASVF